MKTSFRLVCISLFALLTYCGISAQTTAFSTDFNSGIPPEFSGPGFSTGVAGYSAYGFSGNLLRNTATPIQSSTLTLTNLPPHQTVSIKFLLAIIDSWDGTRDFWEVRVDGQQVFYDGFSHNAGFGPHAYQPPAGGLLLNTVHVGYSFPAQESAFDMGLEPDLQDIPHTSSSLVVEFLAAGNDWSGGADESWGIENLSIILDENVTQSIVPTLSQWGLILLGLMVVGTASIAIFRRKYASVVEG